MRKITNIHTIHTQSKSEDTLELNNHLFTSLKIRFSSHFVSLSGNFVNQIIIISRKYCAQIYRDQWRGKSP